LDKAVLEKGKNCKTEFWHWFDYIVGVVTAEKELWRSDNTVPERRKNGTPKKIRQMSALHIGFSAKKKL